MYSKFRLNAALLESHLDSFELNYTINPLDIDKERQKVFRQLKFFEGQSGIIKGKELQQYTFPNGAVNDYDVFISYSHDDVELVKRFCAYLRDYCGLKVFLDYYVWKSADGLLKVIDDKYCKSKDNVHYIYGRRNFSTSHIHAMLSMAILDIINKTECCIFIDSDHSIHMAQLKNSSKARTLSPWLYEELSFMRYLPCQDTIIREKTFSSGMENLFEGVQLKIEHEVDFAGFMNMGKEDMLLLCQYKGTKGLDALYHRYGYKPSRGGVGISDYLAGH